MKRSLMTALSGGLALLVAVAPGRADGQVAALESDFVANGFTTGAQRNPSVAGQAGSGFLVAWDSNGAGGDLQEILLRRFRSGGAPLGLEFQVNEFTTGVQNSPSVSAAADGGFVVAWQSFGQDGAPSSTAVAARRFNAIGTPIGSEFVVNSYTTDGQKEPRVSVSSAGEFVVTWLSGGAVGNTQDGSREGVFASKFDAATLPVGSEFQVNSETTGSQLAAMPAIADDGSFLIVWENGLLSSGDGSQSGVFGRIYDTQANPITAPFAVNTYTSNEQRRPSAVAAADGSFIVVWESFQQDGDGGGIFGRRFGATGVPAGSEFLVNSYTTGTQLEPAIADDGNGGFVVVWQDTGNGFGSPSSVLFGRRLDAGGLPVGSDFAVSSGTQSYLFGQTAAAAGAGRFVVAWNQDTGDGDAAAILARRFAAQALCGDGDGSTAITASDALVALKTGVGASECLTCLCDVNNNGSVSAGDALMILQFAVGQAVSLSCPAC